MIERISTLEFEWLSQEKIIIQLKIGNRIPFSSTLSPELSLSKGSKEQRIKGSKRQRSKGTKNQRFNNSTIQRFKGPKVQRYKDSQIQRSKGSNIQRYKGSKEELNEAPRSITT